MAVFTDIVVDIPKGNNITIVAQPDNKPSLITFVLSTQYSNTKKYSISKRTVIGHQCPGSKTRMHPTTKYRDIFPNEWAKVSNEKVLPSVKRLGLFTACQAVNEKTGIKDILDQTYGDDSNGIMDYAMYSIRFHSDSTQVLQTVMQDELLYSLKPNDDQWYSDLFEKRMSPEKELLFKKKWALQCREDGVEKVWLCIDGSNDDCRSKGVDIAEKGHPKSRQNTNIVSFTYAVTEKGRPVTWETYQGGLVDAKAMKKVIDFLKECGIQVRGVVLDRGYCDAKAIRYLIKKSIAYVIMVKGSPLGYQQIVDAYGEQIKMKAEYWVRGTHLFAAQQKVQLFKSFKHEDFITLFFDYQNGADRVSTLLDHLTEVINKAEGQIQEGKKPVIDKEYESMVTIQELTEDGKNKQEVVLITEGLQEAIDSKGLYSIVSSESMKSEEVHRLYVCRSGCEIQFRTVKTQLGYGKVRVQYTPGVCAKFTVGFAAAVIRYELEQASLDLGKTANQMIQEVDRLQMQKINDAYTYTHTESTRLIDFFRKLGTEDVLGLIDESVKIENDRAMGKKIVPRHRKTGPKKGSHHKKYDDNGNLIKKKPGVTAGTKRPTINSDGTARKKPGCAAGTKRGKYNKDGSLRKKPGPKPGSRHAKAAGAES